LPPLLKMIGTDTSSGPIVKHQRKLKGSLLLSETNEYISKIRGRAQCLRFEYFFRYDEGLSVLHLFSPTMHSYLQSILQMVGCSGRPKN